MSMRFENPLQMLRLLKGAPLSVIFALYLAKKTQAGPVGQEWIARNTGYTDKPISQALALLEDYGLVRRNSRYAWTLTGEALQLPLMGDILESGGNEALAGAEPEVQDMPDSPVEVGSRNISESEKFRLPLASSVIQPESRRDELPPDSRGQNDAEFLRVAQELEALGIREPARSRLARQAHVTVELVRYHCETSQGTGQAIYRIENNWPVKDSPTEWVDAAALPEGSDLPEEPEVSEAAVEAWGKAKSEAQRCMSMGDYRSWVDCAQLVGADNGRYLVGTGNSYSRDWLEKNAGAVLGAALERITGAPAQIEFVIRPM